MYQQQDLLRRALHLQNTNNSDIDINEKDNDVKNNKKSHRESTVKSFIRNIIGTYGRKEVDDNDEEEENFKVNETEQDISENECTDIDQDKVEIYKPCSEKYTYIDLCDDSDTNDNHEDNLLLVNKTRKRKFNEIEYDTSNCATIVDHNNKTKIRKTSKSRTELAFNDTNSFPKISQYPDIIEFLVQTQNKSWRYKKKVPICLLHFDGAFNDVMCEIANEIIACKALNASYLNINEDKLLIANSNINKRKLPLYLLFFNGIIQDHLIHLIKSFVFDNLPAGLIIFSKSESEKICYFKDSMSQNILLYHNGNKMKNIQSFLINEATIMNETDNSKLMVSKNSNDDDIFKHHIDEQQTINPKHHAILDNIEGLLEKMETKIVTNIESIKEVIGNKLDLLTEESQKEARSSKEMADKAINCNFNLDL